MAEDITPPENIYLVAIRFIGLIVGLVFIGWGIWIFVKQMILHPEQGGSVVIPLVAIFGGIFIAVSTRISKKKASAIENRPK